MNVMAEPTVNTIEFESPEESVIKRVLNVGSGPQGVERLHQSFRTADWKEVRYDIDQAVKPDIIGSIVDLREIEDASYDAIWCSHNIEHLHTHDVPKALSEFHRVLKPDGFALISTPDLESIAELIVNGRLEDVAYNSPAGPITALDMLYGLSIAVRQGNLYMTHNTGFTADRLGRLLIESGFAEALAKREAGYNLWGLGLMPEAGKDDLLRHLRANSLEIYPDPAE
jgi:predicted SAM-dependent methyltransferase